MGDGIVVVGGSVDKVGNRLEGSGVLVGLHRVGPQSLSRCLRVRAPMTSLRSASQRASCW